MLTGAPKRPKEDIGGEEEKEVRATQLIRQASSHNMVLSRQLKLCCPETRQAGKFSIDRLPFTVLYVNELQQFKMSLRLISVTGVLFY